MVEENLNSWWQQQQSQKKEKKIRESAVSKLNAQEMIEEAQRIAEQHVQNKPETDKIERVSALRGWLLDAVEIAEVVGLSNDLASETLSLSPTEAATRVDALAKAWKVLLEQSNEAAALDHVDKLNKI